MATSELTHEIGQQKISDGDVLKRLKITGLFNEALGSLVRDRAAQQAAATAGVSVSDDELQAAFDDFRCSLDLHKAADTTGWIEAQGLSVEDVEDYLETGLLRQKLAEKLVTDEQVDADYAQNPKQFEFARVSHIVVADKGAGEELVMSIREDGEDFAAVARKHSVDEATRVGGGYRGLVTRGNTQGLADDVADRIFSAEVGEVVGPFESDDTYCIVRVEENGRRPLDDELRASIRASLCEQMLAEKVG